MRAGRNQRRQRELAGRFGADEVERTLASCVHGIRKRVGHRVRRRGRGAVRQIDVARKVARTNCAGPHPLLVASPDDVVAESGLDALPQGALQEVAAHALQREIPLRICDAGVRQRHVLRR